MASEAEKRLRDKAEGLLREIYPDARIVHEFQVGGARLDIAAITPDRIILVEIKSELDTLDRLPSQLRFARALGGEVWVVYAPKWREPMKLRRNHQDIARPVQRQGYTTYADNPLYVRELSSCVELTEDSETSELVMADFGTHPRVRAESPHKFWMRDRYNSRELLHLLLKPELFSLAKPYGAKSRNDVSSLLEIAHDHMTGQEIRRGVFSALRARRFGWTCDDAIAA